MGMLNPHTWANKDSEYAKKIKNISFKGGNVNLKCLEDFF